MGNKLTYATVCSGIECMSAACPDLPLEPVFFSEIEPFPCAVLKAHYPNVPNLGDMSKIQVSNDGKEITNGSIRIVLDRRLDIFAGGTPCQDVSVAGKRSGMQEGSGTRSSLAFEFVRLIRELKPRFVLWENVAGVLSDPSFPEFLQQIAKCGYSVAYRTLDAQYIRCADIHHQDGRVVSMERAIPQRRRRVWVVGCLGTDVGKVAEILFEHQSIAGNTPPSRKTRKEASNTPRGSHNLHGGMVDGERGDGECDTPGREKLNQHNRTWWDGRETSSTLTTGGNRQFMPDCCRFDAVVEQHQVAYGIDQQGGKGHAAVAKGVSPTMCSDSHGTPHGVAYQRTNGRGENVCNTISADDTTQNGQDHVNLSVVECYNKVSHAKGKDGEGERWEAGEIASTRNVFDISETRTQECIVGMAQNTRNEVRVVGDGQVSGALSAETGTNQQTYVVSHQPQECVVHGLDGYNMAVNNNVSGTLSGAASDLNHTHGVVSHQPATEVDATGVTFDAMKGFPIADGVSQTQITGSSPGHHVGVITHQPATEVLDLQGGKIGAHYTDDGTAPTLTHGRGSASDIHAVTMVSTNSNGGDVMPSISACEYKMGQRQKDTGGGYVIHTAQDVNASICAEKTQDCMLATENNKEQK